MGTERGDLEGRSDRDADRPVEVGERYCLYCIAHPVTGHELCMFGGTHITGDREEATLAREISSQPQTLLRVVHDQLPISLTTPYHSRQPNPLAVI